MDAAPPQHTRGLSLILEHCARLNSFGQVRPSAALRLELLVGDDLARLLMSALVGDHRSGRPQPV
jgi:hypothetical protein